MAILGASMLAASFAKAAVIVNPSINFTSTAFYPVNEYGEYSNLILAGSSFLAEVSGGAEDQRAAITDGLVGGSTTDTTISGAVSPPSQTMSYDNVTSFSITYTFDTFANANGYDIASINSFAGWSKWRVNQIYDISYTTVDDPTLRLLQSVSYTPIVDGNPGGDNVSTWVNVSSDDGMLLSGVNSVTFTIYGDTTQPSGGAMIGAMYREFTVLGDPSAVPEPGAVALLGLAGGWFLFRMRHKARV